ncbi:MAG TPA: S8 family serine peptidase [Woeseiaceae bacterium]|nr:S8 family serine peptidase [Woeseiaceae bacterium]
MSLRTCTLYAHRGKENDVNAAPGMPVAVKAIVAGLVLLAGPGVASGQVLPPLDDPLGRPLDPALERIDDPLGSRIKRRREELEEKIDEPVVDDTVIGTVDDVASGPAGTVVGTVNSTTAAAGSAAQAVTTTLAQALRPFLLAADPLGWPIEQDMVVTLVGAGQLAALRAHGPDVVAQRELPALGVVMVTLRNPPGAGLVQTVTDLKSAFPDAVVDFNHVYRYAEAPDAAPAAESEAGPSDERPAAAPLRVGMIDSAVMAEHIALRESSVVARDFVSNNGRRPLTHGTAVASLIARSADNGAEILSASVFFQTENFAPGATTESMVAALDWLASERVDVINMSLAGPGNALLESAVDAILEQGLPIVAAVGNNGPSGEPLHPAAYAAVIGVTAVDRDGKVFLYANRGEHVDFAALGVDVKVADSEGSWRLESGTSMASPHVAVVVAKTMHADRMTLAALLAALTASAEDLGKDGFDSTFGHGLITDAPVLVSRQ